ncbi:MAG TPA: hypothetical protein VGD78_03115 [Chthoniobacterales bacterium]
MNKWLRPQDIQAIYRRELNQSAGTGSVVLFRRAEHPRASQGVADPIAVGEAPAFDDVLW